ncbi:arginine--tRNA ligase [Desulfurococcus mucosus]|uniref:arginine--tRNA ligase n=1 Tax=Desulfurococcus mucosus (strain ATCC 35584 / DSM 2162 / JCM 9187 / O7/1) TaxID=765177 RepID=E8R8U7_DESM0|nr:arginine--tRNA ligase [Desulfurococcus mucosus]ADV64923.1 Arginine--tRNA ligase [Desulfurococcus mucosus DSM 2162]
MTGLQECITRGLLKALRDVTGIDESLIEGYIRDGKIRVAPTPDPRMGDYGVALHAVLKNYPREKWGEIGESIAGKLVEYSAAECRVKRALFINGYVNVEVDYSSIFKSFMESLLTGKLLEDLRSIGTGRSVVVEHTSANPVHPLHIGSGRNSVIGDTYSRLLKYLGFNVSRLFYVNDLGRQVAVLAYGVRKLRSQGVTPRPGMKIDHWYGVVYALTNILIEEDKLAHELDGLSRELARLVEELEEASRRLIMDKGVTGLERFHSRIASIRGMLSLKHDTVKLLRELYKEIKGLETAGGDAAAYLSEYRGRLRELASKYRELYKEYTGYVKAKSALCREYWEVCRGLASGFNGYEAAEDEIADIMRRAEGGDPETRRLLREVSGEVLKGFLETLSKINVSFDGFDYESSDEVLELSRKVVDRVIESGYARVVDGAVEVDLNKAGEDHEYVKNLFHPDQPGRFIIRRSDGTTLYVTRDIAYTLMKFTRHRAEKVYNVIAVEQSRAQKQLKAVLYLLGYRREADNLVHFSYEMVHLKGMRMSGRRGIYYTVDELLMDMENSIIGKHLEETGGFKREATGDYMELRSVAGILAVNNTRALLLSVEPGKVLSFDPGRIGVFEHGITVTYGLVRAQSILRRLWGVEPLDDASIVKTRGLDTLSSLKQEELGFNVEEKQLLEALVGYPMVLREAYEYMRPDRLLEYASGLSLAFNRMYEKHRVINEPDPVRKNIRVLLTIAVLLVLSDLADIMGFHKPRRL